MNAYCDLNKITSFCLKKPLIFQLRRLWLFEVRNISGHSLDCLLNELNSPIISYRPGNYKATMTETLQLLHSNFRNDRSPGQLDCPPTDHHVIIISPRRGRVGMLVNLSKLLLQIPRNPLFKINMTPAKESPLKKFTQVKLLRFIHWTQQMFLGLKRNHHASPSMVHGHRAIFDGTQEKHQEDTTRSSNGFLVRGFGAQASESEKTFGTQGRKTHSKPSALYLQVRVAPLRPLPVRL